MVFFAPKLYEYVYTMQSVYVTRAILDSSFRKL
jgi:hypothetical protein